MADRVLVEIVTAANMTGIKEAQAGFLGMSSALSVAIVGLGLAVVATKSAIEITEKHEKAESDLAQALKVSGGNTVQAQKFLDSFIDSNRAYISDQSEVIDGYAILTRAGLNQNQVQKDMNRALDLAAIKHISLGDAVALVNQAEHGRLRGLVDLGITSKSYVDSSGNVVDANKNMAKVMDELDRKTAHGRDTTTQMAQSTNKLGNDWTDIALIAGPPVLDFLSGVLSDVDWLIRKLNELGHNQDWNKFLHDAFGGLQRDVLIVTLGVRELLKLLGIAQGAAKGVGGSLGGLLSGGGGNPGRQGGGYVWPGNTYTVGESRPEGLTMFPGGGGYVSSSMPSSSGGSRGSMTVNVYGYVGDNRQLALTIRESLRRLDREQR